MAIVVFRKMIYYMFLDVNTVRIYVFCVSLIFTFKKFSLQTDKSYKNKIKLR